MPSQFTYDWYVEIRISCRPCLALCSNLLFLPGVLHERITNSATVVDHHFAPSSVGRYTRCDLVLSNLWRGGKI